MRVADLETIFVLTRQYVIGCAEQMGIPPEAITDDVLYHIKKGIEFGLESWAEVVRVAVNLALKG